MKKLHLDAAAPRQELHDLLSLTGAEVSVNRLPAMAAVPFVHRHRQNEEIYGVLEGKGEIFLDGEVTPIEAGDWFKVEPKSARAIRALEEGVTFICIQVKANSLTQFTMGDGELVGDQKAPWL